MTIDNKTDFKDSCLIPIVIGITGHRDLLDDDIPRHKIEIAKFFQKLHKKHPDSPLVLLSLMAEGADRITADVALELQGEGFPIKLIVALPLPKEEYKESFETLESKTYLDSVLARKDVIHFELPPINNDTAGSISEQSQLRSIHFFAGGRFVVEHCQILVALWDGVDNDKVGGTSDVVEMQLKGDTMRTDWSENIFSPLTTGPVCHIVTRRKSHSSSGKSTPNIKFLEDHLDREISHKISLEPFGLNHLSPLEEITRKSLKREKGKVLKNINDYNRDLRDNHDKLKRKYSSEAHYLLPSDLYCPPELETFKRYYACSSAIAAEYKNKVMSLLKFIAYSMPLTVLSFEYYSNKTVSHVFWMLYAILAGSAYLYYWLSKRGRHHDKFLDYRALAEGIRVHFYWKLAGIKESAATFYLNKHLSELEWIRYALRNLDLLLLKQGENKVNQKADDKINVDTKIQENINGVIEYWINGQNGQKDYFAKSTIKQKKIHEAMEKWANSVFYFGLFVTTPALLINHALYPGGHADHWFHIFVPVILVIAGAIKFYNEKMLYKQNSKQYRRMFDIFSQAANRLNRISKDLSISQDNKVKESQKILEFLGKEALAENGDWLIMHREQPIEVPQKG